MTKAKTNKDYILMANDLTNLIALSTRKIYNAVENGAQVVKTIEPVIDIPNSIAYNILSNRRILNVILDEGKEIEETLTEEIKKELKKEAEGSKETPLTEEEINKKVYLELNKRMNTVGGIYEKFLNSKPVKELEFKKIKLTLGKQKGSNFINLKEEDPENKFKFTYIGENLIDTIFFIEA